MVLTRQDDSPTELAPEDAAGNGRTPAASPERGPRTQVGEAHEKPPRSEVG